MNLGSQKIAGGKYVGAVLFAGICFGTTGTAQALGPKGASPLVVGTARLIVGALLLWVIHLLLRQEGNRIKAPELLLAGVGVALYQLSFFSAVRSTGVAIGTLIAIGSAPAFTGFMAKLIYGENPTKRWLFSTLITTLGIGFLSLARGIHQVHITGIALALGAGASYSIFAVASKSAMRAGTSFTESMWKVFGLGALLLSPILFIANIHSIFTFKGISMSIWLGLVPTAMAYTSYAYGLRHIRVATASTLIIAEPATATILAAVVLGETVNIYSILGIIIVIAGLTYLALE